MKYKIVCVKKNYLQIAQKYPCFLKQIYQIQNNMYKTRQIELVFSNMSKEKERILNFIQSREDYSYFHGTHQLLNPITNEKICLIMNEYDLEVEEEGDHCYLFGVISSFSENFCMITK